MTKRTLPALQLSSTPLVLVLCQVRIAAIQNMANYIPDIQDRLRREEFPVDLSREIQEVSLQPDGSATTRRRAHWEFRTLEEDWSIIVSEGAVVLLTTRYNNFDEFLRYLSLAMGTVDELVGSLVIERVGLRYVDLVRPGVGETWKDYVQSGFHGIESQLVAPEKAALSAQIVADTGQSQRMILRLSQNWEGKVLPPDLLAYPPKLQAKAEPGELLTLLDLDHYREARYPFEIEALIDAAWELHDGLDILFRDMVTQHALEVWE